MQAGMTEFDAAVGGLGGCPYAPNASGNIATEDLVNMMNELGIETGVNLDAVLHVAEMLKEAVPHPLHSSLIKAGRPWSLLKAPEQQMKIG
jgi:hydroxymethylglutaryl-CoA lyase